MSRIRDARRTLTGGAVAIVLALSACSAPSTETEGANAGEVPAKPSEPVTLNVLDVAGNLQLTKGMIENFARANPDIVEDVTYTSAPAPNMAGRLQAEQQGGDATTSLVLSGTDGLAAGIDTGVLEKLIPTFEDRFPGLMQNYLPPAADMQGLAEGYGIELVYYPSGPLLEYDPSRVTDVPSSPQELLAYAKANPGKVQYADPANSGPGRTWLMGLPYLLGDKDPTDPAEGWDKTWAYLQELGKYTAPYPTGTDETMENLASGSVDIILSTTGWDINPRALGTVPANVEVAVMDNHTWVSDAQYALVPKGLSGDQLSANLALIKWMLKPDQQAIAYDSGYFYPGPAVKGVSLDMAPQKSQSVIQKYGRPQYDQWIGQFPVETSLPAEKQVEAFDKWNRLVGSQ